MDAQAGLIRTSLGFSARGAELARYSTEDGYIIVVADGYGKAYVGEFEGPDAQNCNEIRGAFLSEAKACAKAEKWSQE